MWDASRRQAIRRANEAVQIRKDQYAEGQSQIQWQVEEGAI